MKAMRKPAGIANACRLENVRPGMRCCANCVSFDTTDADSPRGWCYIYPCKNPNTSENRVCPAFEERRPKA